MSQNDFFRAEALIVPSQQYGHVFLNIPLEMRIVTFTGVFLLICVLCFAIFFDFAETCRIPGSLVPDPGMINIYPQKSGHILQSYAHTGEHVKKGAPLFLLDTSLEGNESRDAHYRWHMLNKNQRALTKEISEKTNQHNALSILKAKKYISLEVYQSSKDTLRDLHKKLRAINLELMSEKRSNRWLLRAPVDGVLTQLGVQSGDRLSLDTCAAIILPEQSKMVAELYTSMHQIRFLKNHQPIVLRYDAYPDGAVARGTLKRLGASAVHDPIGKKASSLESTYYTAIATLQQQKIFSDGELRDLKPGMTLWATVKGPHKKIWQWLLGPLYNSIHESLT